MSPRDNTRPASAVTPASLTSLPVELLCDVMKYLAFSDSVRLSHVNAYLRSAAVGNPAPWANFAVPIRRDNIDALDQLVKRPLPERLLHVAIVDITPDDLQPLCTFLTQYLGRIGALGLYFASLDVKQHDAYNSDMGSLWQAFSRQAAEHLVSLALCGGRRPIHTISASIFNSVPPTRLHTLLIEGFRVDDVRPAFARVAAVSIDLAALPNTPAAPSLGALFPDAHLIAITRCESYPVQGADGALVPHDHLSRLPQLSAAHPVCQLHLTWARVPHGAAARWLEAAAAHVRFLSVLCPDNAEVRGAALRRAGSGAGTLAVLPTAGGGTAVRACVHYMDGERSSSQIIVPPDEAPRLGDVVASVAPYAPHVATLVLSSSRLGALAGVTGGRYRRLCHLVLYLERENVGPDGMLVDASGVGIPQIAQLTHVEVYAIAPVTVYSAALLAFVQHVAPNCTEFFKVSPYHVNINCPGLLLKVFPQALSHRSK